jgi:hypothetical protein
MDAITGLKGSPWAELGNWTIHFLLDDITTFNIAFPIPYKLQKAQV